MSAPKAARERYAEYLQSDHWKALRIKALNASGSQCECCLHKHGLEIHHIHYRNLTDCEVSDLMVLCFRCHEFAHQAFELARKRPMDFSRLQTIQAIQRFVAQGKQPVKQNQRLEKEERFQQSVRLHLHNCKASRNSSTAVRILISNLRLALSELDGEPSANP